MKDIRVLYSRANLSIFFFAVLAAIALVFIAEAQEKGANITYTNPASGSEMYSAYCAVCHGATGNGNGPAASVFTKPPTNLTMLAKNNNGKYPTEHVYAVLRFGTHVPAHGNIQMPVWNTLFRSLTSAEDPDSVTKLRIRNLVSSAFCTPCAPPLTYTFNLSGHRGRAIESGAVAYVFKSTHSERHDSGSGIGSRSKAFVSAALR